MKTILTSWDQITMVRNAQHQEWELRRKLGSGQTHLVIRSLPHLRSEKRPPELVQPCRAYLQAPAWASPRATKVNPPLAFPLKWVRRS